MPFSPTQAPLIVGNPISIGEVRLQLLDPETFPCVKNVPQALDNLYDTTDFHQSGVATVVQEVQLNETLACLQSDDLFLVAAGRKATAIIEMRDQASYHEILRAFAPAGIQSEMNSRLGRHLIFYCGIRESQ